MELSFISYILLLAIITIAFLLITKRKHEALYLAIGLLFFFELAVERGFFVRLHNGFILNYDEFLILFFSPLFFIMLLNDKLSTKHWMVFIGMLLSIAMGLFVLNYFPVSYKIIPFYEQVDAVFSGKAPMGYAYIHLEHIRKIIRLIAYAPILLLIGSSYLDKLKLFSLLLIISKVICIILIFELIVKSTYQVYWYDMFLQNIFNDNISLVHMRAGYSTLKGLTTEPSHLAHAFIVPLFILATKDIYGKVYWLLIIVVLLILSVSFTNFMIAILSLMLYYLYSPSFKKYKNISFFVFSIISMLTIWVIASVYYEIIEYNVVRGYRLFTADFLSGDDVRLWTISENLKYFFNRPFFGIGFGSTKANGFIPSMLANLGLVGSYFWIMWHHYSLRIKSYNTLSLFFMLLILFFTGNTVWLYTINMPLIFLAISSKRNASGEIAFSNTQAA